MWYRTRRIATVIIVVIAAVWWLASQYVATQSPAQTTATPETHSTLQTTPAQSALETIPVKGRAPKTGYARTQFGDGWLRIGGCDTRNIILNRDLKEVSFDDSCHVMKGILNDPYTGKIVSFVRGTDTSDDVQIDHVVALSNAWQTGAQQLTRERRIEFANDPLELLAVDGPANQAKSDGDAATWLPPNKAFRCQYVARQIAVKIKYDLWVTVSEKQAMERVLSSCADQTLPG